jgi:hypothetical protein
MDDLYMMMGDDPSVYLTPADDIAALVAPSTSHLMDDDDDDDDSDSEEEFTRRRRINSSVRVEGESITNSTNQQMLDVVNNKKRKGNRRQQQHNNNRNRNRNNNNQNDGTSSFDENNPINVISAFNRTGKIYNKLRKNDAVKVIDTPSGRAGFVYQSGSSGSNSQSGSSNSNSSPSIKESSSNWEDSYSQSSQFVNRNANDVKLVPSSDDSMSNKKIMPVRTADGKIALVVRGDTSRQIFDENQNNGSGNSVNTKKYEPITNLTSIIEALNSNNDNNNHHQKPNETVTEINSELKVIQEQNRVINRLDEFFASVTNKIKNMEEEIEHKLGIDVEEGEESVGEEVEFDAMTTSTTSTTPEPIFDGEDEMNKKDSLLINRPLSEVLGLPKKTHYHHPHDPFQATPEIPPIKSHSENNRRINTVQRTHLEAVPTTGTTTTTTDSSQGEEFDLESPEKINIAVIPRFDSELEERLFGKKSLRNNNVDDNEVSHASSAISSIHCAMQVMVAVACACTILGVLGSYYRIPLANQFRGIYW